MLIGIRNRRKIRVQIILLHISSVFFLLLGVFPFKIKAINEDGVIGILRKRFKKHR